MAPNGGRRGMTSTFFSSHLSNEMISNKSNKDYLSQNLMTNNLSCELCDCVSCTCDPIEVSATSTVKSFLLFPTSSGEMSKINSMLEVVKTTHESNKAVPIEDASNIDMSTIEDYVEDRSFVKHAEVEVPCVCTKCGIQQQLQVVDTDTKWQCIDCKGKLMQLDTHIVLEDRDWEGLLNDDIRREEAGSGENAFDVLGIKTSESLSRLGLTELTCEHHKGLLVPEKSGDGYEQSKLPKMIDSIHTERDANLDSKDIWKPTEAETVFNRKTGTSGSARFARSFPLTEAGEKNYDAQESLQYVPKLTSSYYITVPYTDEQLVKLRELESQKETAMMHMLINKTLALPHENVEVQYMTTSENCGNNPPQVAVINKHFVKTGIIPAVDYKDMTYSEASKVMKNYFWAKKNGRQDIVNQSIKKIRQACTHLPPTESQMRGDSVAIGNDVDFIIKEGINGQTSTTVPSHEPHTTYLVDGRAPTYEERLIRRLTKLIIRTNSDWKKAKIQKRIDKISSDMEKSISSQLSIKQIFVFGSNLAGHHTNGAAEFAQENHGAIHGQGVGLQGSSYAIPTKDESVITLPLEVIGKHVAEFAEFAKKNPELQFNVTKIGCGLAGYNTSQIGPLFRDCHGIENMTLPVEFESDSFKLGIVGSSKADSKVERRIRDLVTDYQTLYGTKLIIVSGGASGVDGMAEKIAKELGVTTEIHNPTSQNKDAYKVRNMEIAKASNEVVSIALPLTKTKCYHCDENHERTGGCWTTSMARNQGIIGRTIVVD